MIFPKPIRGIRQSVSLIVDNKYPIPKAIKPNSGLNTRIIVKNVTIEMILLYRMRLLCSAPNSLDVKILVNVNGIIQKVIILRISTISHIFN